MMPGHIVRFAIAIVAFAILARLPVGLDPAFQFDAALAIIWGFGILSLVLLTGYAGQVSLCQATFAGVAAYGAGMTVASMHGGYLLGIVIGVLAATVLGVIVGLPALRLHGITLAIVTLGIALVFDKYVFQDHIFDWFTGGTGGWQVTQASLLGIPVDSSTHLLTAYDVMLALFCLVAVLMGVRYVPAAGLGGLFMAVVPDVLTRYGHGTFMNRFNYEISYDWFQLAVGVLLVLQLILLPDGVWGDIRAKALGAWDLVRMKPREEVRPA